MARILFIADVHGNLDALKAVVDSVPYDEAICLGDLVDYGPEPAECIDWISKNCSVTIRGNHDNAVALKVDCGCGYVYKHLSVATREYTWASISDDDMAFLRSLPLIVEKEVDGVKLVLAHGSPKSFFDYIFPDTPAERLRELTASIHGDYLAVGHTHKPCILRRDRLAVANPGSVGQPRDGDTRASCLILDTAAVEARIIRVTYDIEVVSRKIRARMPLADELIAILKRGH